MLSKEINILHDNTPMNRIILSRYDKLSTIHNNDNNITILIQVTTFSKKLLTQKAPMVYN